MDNRNGNANRLSESMRWALAVNGDAAMAAADWLAADIDNGYESATALLVDADASLEKINAAKDAFKTMRIVGETKADRSIGARLYAAAIAAGLVHHDQRISRQSDAALRRAFTGLNDDADMPQPLRNLAASALVRLPRATN